MTDAAPDAAPDLEPDAGPGSVSAVVPCYNGERFLAETLDSLLAQTRPVCEIIVVDDGSTDGSAALAESFDGRNGVPVRVIRQANSGESVARNRAVGRAAGEWIGFCDADDLWRPDKLARLLAAAGPDDVAVHSNVRLFGAETGVTRLQDVPDRYDLPVLARGNHFRSPSAVLVRRSACPRFPEWTGVAEDLVFFLELVRRGPVAFVEAPLTDYRKHAASQSAGPEAMLGWNETVREWLRRSPDVPAETAESIRRHWLRHLAAAGRLLMERADWGAFRTYQSRLAAYAGEEPRLDAFLAEPRHPKPVYRARGLVRPAWTALRRLARPAATSAGAAG